MKRARFSRAAFLLLLAAWIPCCARRSSGPPDEAISLKTDKDLLKNAADLEKEIPVLMTEFNIPGLSMALVRNHEVAWLGAFGVLNAETKQRVNLGTVFEAAPKKK